MKHFGSKFLIFWRSRVLLSILILCPSLTESGHGGSPVAARDDVCDQPIICFKPRFIPNPNNCNLFHTCVLAAPPPAPYALSRYDFRCGDGLWWDERLETCNWPDQVIPRPACADCARKYF